MQNAVTLNLKISTDVLCVINGNDAQKCDQTVRLFAG